MPNKKCLIACSKKINPRGFLEDKAGETTQQCSYGALLKILVSLCPQGRACLIPNSLIRPVLNDPAKILRTHKHHFLKPYFETKILPRRYLVISALIRPNSLTSFASPTSFAGGLSETKYLTAQVGFIYSNFTTFKQWPSVHP